VNNLAKWLAEQRLRRVVFIAGLFPMPVLGLFGAAVVVMTAYLNGFRDALVDVGLALLLLMAIAWASGMDVPVLALSAALSWLAWLSLGAIAGQSGSLTLALQAAVLMALAGLVAMYLAFGDGAEYWTTILTTIYADLAEQGVDVEVDIKQQAALMNGLLVTGSFVGAVLGLLLGSSWAIAVRGGVFAAQFQQIRLGYVIGGLAALAGVAEVFGIDTSGAVLLFGAAFMFHGMSVTGWWASRLKWPRGWWVGLCILPILIPDLFIAGLLLFATLGFVDNWYSLRRVSA
jgi:hypothetical protein